MVIKQHVLFAAFAMLLVGSGAWGDEIPPTAPPRLGTSRFAAPVPDVPRVPVGPAKPYAPASRPVQSKRSNVSPHLRVLLRDGSRLIGKWGDLKSLSVKTQFGTLEIPTSKVARISGEKEAGKQVAVKMSNGDLISGELENATLIILAKWGNVEFGVSEMAQIEVTVKDPTPQLAVNQLGQTRWVEPTEVQPSKMAPQNTHNTVIWHSTGAASPYPVDGRKTITYPPVRAPAVTPVPPATYAPVPPTTYAPVPPPSPSPKAEPLRTSSTESVFEFFVSGGR